MKKKFIIIVFIIILLLAGLVTSYIDSARVRNGVEPKFAIKIASYDGNKITYWGLGYKVIRYPAVSPKESFKSSLGVKYGSWFMKYELEEEKETKYSPTKLENVSISIYDISLTGATIIIKDTNKNPYTYGDWYKIEKQINGKWYEVETIIDNYGFNEIGNAAAMLTYENDKTIVAKAKVEIKNKI